MKNLIARLLVMTLLTPSVALAVDSKGAAYVGGTVTAFAGSKDPIDGTLSTAHEDGLVFAADQKPFKGQSVTIKYADIIDLEYGQKAGRRVGAAIGTSLLLGPIGLVTLFSKKRNHFLTIGYHGETGIDQVVVLELGKDIVRITLPIVETRSGKTIAYQDEDARKAAK
jgi:hypothetical protein